MRITIIISIFLLVSLFSAAAQQKMNIADTAKHHMVMHHIGKSQKNKKRTANGKHRSMKGMKMSPAASRKKMVTPMKDMHHGSMTGMNMSDSGKSVKSGVMTMPMNGMQMGGTSKSSPGKKMNMPMTDKPMKGMNMKDTSTAAMDMTAHPMGGMKMNEMMSSSQSKNLPMERDGSGTSWLPDASPMYGIMLNSGKWSYMLHGNISVRYTKQGLSDKGSRGGDKFDAPNWFMGMAQRPVGENGLLHFNLMMSLDPLTEGGYGYPLLFQTGESWKGMPLVDRQHPHDLFSELSASYAYAFSTKTDLSIYIGYPGEPALGPAAFMHRPSAMSDPDAPISHHWSDATHITFGVATIGFRFNQFKIEASSFTGREPDENRYDFDKPKFDSWSGRLNFNPSSNWALQVSHGFIKSPEALNPTEDIYRTTASATYSLPFGDEKTINATALWGQNKSPGKTADNSALLEGDIRVKKLAIYTRYEFVQKTTDELTLNPALYGDNSIFPVNALTLGVNYDLFKLGPLNLAAGGQLTWYTADSRLNNLYGANPMAGEVFLRIYPRLMKSKM